MAFRDLMHYREGSYGLKGRSSHPHWLSLRLDNWCNIRARVHLDPAGRSTHHTHPFPSSHPSYQVSIHTKSPLHHRRKISAKEYALFPPLSPHRLSFPSFSPISLALSGNKGQPSDRTTPLVQYAPQRPLHIVNHFLLTFYYTSYVRRDYDTPTLTTASTNSDSVEQKGALFLADGDFALI